MHLSFALLSAAIICANAQPHAHAHGHAHLHKHKRDPVPDQVVVPGPVEVVYVLNGIAISEADVQQGVKNGSLIFADNGELADAPPNYVVPTSTPVAASSAPPTSIAPTSSAAPSSSPVPVSSAAEASSKPSEPSPPTYSGGDGVDRDFPDGELDCSTFPSDYGAIPVPWTGLKGWTGIQTCSGGSDSGGYEHISTKTSGQSPEEGDYCSYACPAGYQKSQWPSTQGSTGQSIGGIKCSGGKLHLTNPGLSKKLCIRGAEAVTILVQNKLSKNVAVCRTDYPGTESETVPVNVEAGSTNNLTCPDADNYYKWQGGSTSAQYYVNPAGVAVEDACTWGTAANPWGNFAPMNIGVGWSNGAAWLSVFQNSPTTDAKQKFTVEIVGDGVSGTCKYQNGQYCGGANYDSCSSTTGCTVSLSSGTATFVFSD
ncbi:SUN domain protein (Uth1) [Zymoseptoria brevis]|uniref:SUN domain protein (Uth1) n=1 Tax=Zymoseptoria brevis TaxID=1047168 RepID=A0A0F4GVC1_9PEZI|nr:SUN domain protein (Uth1) [Zymoseptoria brevis]